MKAYELQNSFGIDQVTLTERPDPRPSAGQVLLRMRAWEAQTRGDGATYHHYREMANSLGFEGHIAWAELTTMENVSRKPQPLGRGRVCDKFVGSGC